MKQKARMIPVLLVVALATLNDSPTVTYTPMAGERFARSLMMPTLASVILNLMQAVSPVDEVFRISVQSVETHQNERSHHPLRFQRQGSDGGHLT
jgi:hypothetical protein